MRSLPSAGGSSVCAKGWGEGMGILEIIGGVLAVALFFYLLLALLAPEKLS